MWRAIPFLALLLAGCVSSADMRNVEGQMRELGVAMTQTANDVGSIATDLETVEASGEGNYASVGARLGEIAGRLVDVATRADDAADTAGQAADDAEALEARIPQGGGITGNPLIDLAVGMAITAGTTYLGINKARDKKYVGAAPVSTRPPGGAA